MRPFLDKFTMSVNEDWIPRHSNHIIYQSQNQSQNQLIIHLYFHLRTNFPCNFRCQYKWFHYFSYVKQPKVILKLPTSKWDFKNIEIIGREDRLGRKWYAMSFDFHHPQSHFCGFIPPPCSPPHPLLKWQQSKSCMVLSSALQKCLRRF